MTEHASPEVASERPVIPATASDGMDPVPSAEAFDLVAPALAFRPDGSSWLDNPAGEAA